MAIDRRGRDERPGEGAGESFIGRWSRRKRAARVEPSPLEPGSARDGGRAGTPESTVSAAVEPSPAETSPGAPEPVLTDADMPPLETLDAQSDWTGFMSPGVSPELRKAALRKLFHLPQFNVRDGLNDYDEDFTSFEPLGDVVTSDMRHQIEREEAEARAAQERERVEAEVEQTRAGQTEVEQTEVEQTEPEQARAEREAEEGEAIAGASSTAQPSGGPSKPRGQSAPATEGPEGDATQDPSRAVASPEERRG